MIRRRIRLSRVNVHTLLSNPVVFSQWTNACLTWIYSFFFFHPMHPYADMHTWVQCTLCCVTHLWSSPSLLNSKSDQKHASSLANSTVFLWHSDAFITERASVCARACVSLFHSNHRQRQVLQGS